jgi:TniQ
MTSSHVITDTTPTRLPVVVRPRPPETAESYVRRLAEANHYPPSQLRKYLSGPPDYVGSISTQRLATLTGRTVDALLRAFPSLRETPRPRRIFEPTEPRDDRELFSRIRRHATTSGFAQIIDVMAQQLATKFNVTPNAVLLALAGGTRRTRRQRRRQPKRFPCLDQLSDRIDAMLATRPDITVMQIWERLVDDHAAEISYSSVREYVARWRREITATPRRTRGRSKAETDQIE